MINKMIIETLANEESDQIVLDIEGIRRQYTFLQDSLPNTQIRFAIKACPNDEILTALAQKGAGFDAASPNEIIAAIKSEANLENDKGWHRPFRLTLAATITVYYRARKIYGG